MIFWAQHCAFGSMVVVAVDVVVVVVVVGGGAPAWAVDNQTKQIQVYMHQFKGRTGQSQKQGKGEEGVRLSLPPSLPN